MKKKPQGMTIRQGEEIIPGSTMPCEYKGTTLDHDCPGRLLVHNILRFEGDVKLNEAYCKKTSNDEVNYKHCPVYKILKKFNIDFENLKKEK